ncbi:hypothetical protein COU77_01780 [Candidatus Peregrinibacteria bacterium CG10_big_fil_rev_8_21_14_0_10_49_16]|nr:MAG: hypothetical protein COW95_03745 [Candidatus Peregrinibacteria bacterium CG22_combo_CG10-13_8_21_14_all_49_11]PIR52171.1 MAG: hypothetical protein COU77_01780 [Candidatus Peregrinibacteria bacterium CG10_big_fil_rev_8_21_14_0_10_49_16]
MHMLLFLLLSLLPLRTEAASWPPRILPRTEWGADNELLFSRKREEYHEERIESTNDQPEVSSSTPGNRASDCEKWQQEHPEEFRPARTERRDAQGGLYRWPQQYSPQVQLLVLHHTALAVGTDTRSPRERVQALYEYHSDGKGWGDIGYHFIVDEEGTIYEGRAGGDAVIGGHAYCWNTGTVGIALLGNFELEQPTQDQINSLQWLLDHLIKKYDINLAKSVSFHGKTLPPIVGHDDLLSTVCPGHYMDYVLPQVREHVYKGTLTASVTFPRTYAKERRVSPRERLALTRTQQRLNRYVSTPTISKRRLYRAQRGGVSALVPQNISNHMNASNSRVRRDAIYSVSTSQYTSSLVPHIAEKPNTESPTIRIHLTTTGNTHTLLLPITTTINGQSPQGGSLTLTQSGKNCKAQINHMTIQSDILRIDPGNGILTLQDGTRRYRGILECRILDGKLTLMNELSLEEYLWGLAEEPDTEPFEKQRAFAIAARTYAAHYLQNSQRKFSGKPYDGSDSPAEFQAYGGANFEARNPEWVRAVKETAGQILTKAGTPIRAAYYSSNDGRTRSPAEIGWNTFPFAEVFASKPDPWCAGMPNRGHGVGMSGCGAEGQANEGKSAEDILRYYYPGTRVGTSDLVSQE